MAYSVLAGKRAELKYANVDAAEFFRRALDAAHELPSLTRSDPLARVGVTRRCARAERELRRCARRLPQRAAIRPRRRGRAGGPLHEGRAAPGERGAVLGRAALVHARARHAREAGGRCEREQRLELSLGYAGTRFRQGALADCVQWCARSVEEARSAGALAELAHAYYLLHLAYTSLGQPRTRRASATSRCRSTKSSATSSGRRTR